MFGADVNVMIVTRGVDELVDFATEHFARQTTLVTLICRDVVQASFPAVIDGKLTVSDGGEHTLMLQRSRESIAWSAGRYLQGNRVH